MIYHRSVLVFFIWYAIPFTDFGHRVNHLKSSSKPNPPRRDRSLLKKFIHFTVFLPTKPMNYRHIIFR